MSPYLPQVKAKDLARITKKLGFLLDRQKGSHPSTTELPIRQEWLFPCMQAVILNPKPCAVLLTIYNLPQSNSKNSYKEDQQNSGELNHVMRI
jgi:hypothetical protein